jgi:predicted nucleic acid-binding protein
MARLIIDTSGYLVGASTRHPQHTTVRDLLAYAPEPPVVSPLVLAEIDYLVLDQAGVAREIEVIDDLTSGAYDVADVDVDDLRRARQVAVRYRDLKIGLTDAVNVVLAERYETNELLTTDQRHFRAVAPLSKKFAAFRLIPSDL